MIINGEAQGQGNFSLYLCSIPSYQPIQPSCTKEKVFLHPLAFPCMADCCYISLDACLHWWWGVGAGSVFSWSRVILDRPCDENTVWGFLSFQIPLSYHSQSSLYIYGRFYVTVFCLSPSGRTPMIMLVWSPNLLLPKGSFPPYYTCNNLPFIVS